MNCHPKTSKELKLEIKKRKSLTPSFQILKEIECFEIELLELEKIKKS